MARCHFAIVETVVESHAKFRWRMVCPPFLGRNYRVSLFHGRNYCASYNCKAKYMPRYLSLLRVQMIINVSCDALCTYLCTSILLAFISLTSLHSYTTLNLQSFYECSSSNAFIDVKNYVVVFFSF